MKFKRLRMLVRLVTCFLILLAVAVQRNGSVFGHDLTSAPAAGTEDSEAPVITESEGATIINTTTLTSGIKGYGGPVPLEIEIKDDRIAGIIPLKNAESEEFFSAVRDEIIPRWVGTPIDSVADKNVDAVTGATLSSNALNANVKAGVAYALKEGYTANKGSYGSFKLTFKYIAALLVVLCAAILPIFIRNRHYRYIQLILNVIVLGFWSGTFLSYEVFVNYIANGANLLQSLAVLLMLVTAFLYQYFNRPNHYCTWVCPLGSLQEIAGKTTKFKLKMSPRLVRALSIFRECLWLLLMFVMCAGIFFDWMNWELFTAFIFNQAALGVVIAAVVFVLLSVVVNRPYCRFVCPTGCLFQITQNPDYISLKPRSGASPKTPSQK